MNKQCVGWAHVPLSDVWSLVLCTLRYAMGRSSYITSEACRYVREYAGYMRQNEVNQIAVEIREAVAYAHKRGDMLGMKMDEDGFVRLAEEIESGVVVGRVEA